MAFDQSHMSKAFRLRKKLRAGESLTDEEKAFLTEYAATKDRPGRKRSPTPTEAKAIAAKSTIAPETPSNPDAGDSPPVVEKQAESKPETPTTGPPPPPRPDKESPATGSDGKKAEEGKKDAPTFDLDKIAEGIATTYCTFVKASQHAIETAEWKVFGVPIPALPDELIDTVVHAATVFAVKDYVKSNASAFDPAKSAKFIAFAPTVEYAAFMADSWYRSKKKKQTETKAATPVSAPAPATPTPAAPTPAASTEQPASTPKPEPGNGVTRRQSVASTASWSKVSYK